MSELTPCSHAAAGHLRSPRDGRSRSPLPWRDNMPWARPARDEPGGHDDGPVANFPSASSTHDGAGLWRQFTLCLTRAARQHVLCDSFVFEVAFLCVVGCAMGMISSDSKVGIGLPDIYCALTNPENSMSFQACVLPNLTELATMVTMNTMFIIGISGIMSISTFGSERIIYFRESRSGLNTTPYFAAKLAVDLVRIFAGAAAFSIGHETFRSTPADPIRQHWPRLALYLYGWAWGYITSILVAPETASMCILVIMSSSVTILSGVSPTLVEVEAGSPGLAWIWSLAGSRWLVEAMYVSEIEYFAINPLNASQPYIDFKYLLTATTYDVDGFDVAVGNGFAISVALMMITGLRMRFANQSQKL